MGMKPIEGGGVRKVPINVVESRVTNLGVHILIGASLGLAGLLKFVPKPVLLGVFLFMGVSSLNGNELFERLYLWAIWDSSKYPKYSYVKTVSSNKIHIFTFFIAALVPIRWSFAKIFTPEELLALDGQEDEEEETTKVDVEVAADAPPVLLGSTVPLEHDIKPEI